MAAGDAAAAFDPISALGIGFSLRSGMEAARVAAAATEEDAGPAAAYAASITRIYEDYRSRLHGIYSQEQRWPDLVLGTAKTAAALIEITSRDPSPASARTAGGP